MCWTAKNRLKCSEIKEKFVKLKFDKFNIFKQFEIEKNWTYSELNDPFNKFLDYYIQLKLNELCDEFENSLDEYASEPGIFTRFRDDCNHIYYIYVAKLHNSSDESRFLICFIKKYIIY